MDNKRRLTNKYILLAILLIAVFVLPGCRTRITNNSEVGNVQYDEDGFMSETYQERRDELGLSTAERPIMPNLGSGEADNNDDFAEGESIDYNPEEFEEDFTEPENNTNSETNNNTNTNTTTRPGTTTPTRRTTPTTRRSPTGTTTTKVTVTFNANGGSIDGKSTKAVSYTKGAKLGTLPKPTHSDSNQEFEGWYTSKTGGSSVKSTDTVSASRTLYAHWKTKEVSPPTPTPEPQPEVKYIVSLNANGGSGDSEESIAKDGKYTLPELTRKGYIHIAWTTNKDGSGTTYAPKEIIKVTDNLTLYAKWEGNLKELEYWEDAFKQDVKGIEEEPNCFVEGGDTKIVQDCKAKAKTNEEDLGSADYVVAYVEDDSDQEAIDAVVAKYSEKTLLVIPKNANKNDKTKMVYKLIILSWLHGTSLSYANAADNLGVSYQIFYPDSV